MPGLFDPKVTQETTTGSSAPWINQQPYLDFGFDQAHQIYENGGPQFYDGKTYSPFSIQQEQGLGMITDRAMNGSDVNRNASTLMADTLNGDYLNSNPYIDQVYDTMSKKMMGGVNSQFAGHGRFGSGIHQDVMGENLGDMAGNLYYNNYVNERGNQMNAMQMAPSIANQDYYDANMMMGAGGMVQDQADKALTHKMNKWNYNQNLPNMNLQNYMQNIEGQYGAEKSATTPMYSNSTGVNVLGAAGAGLGLLDTANDLFKWWD